jgi:hypothetical protein
VVTTLSKGYDLEYIWAPLDRGPVKDAASYYLQASQSGGEPPGRWWGPGAAALGLEPGQVVTISGSVASALKPFSDPELEFRRWAALCLARPRAARGRLSAGSGDGY